jgi:hypothetical protein
MRQGARDIEGGCAGVRVHRAKRTQRRYLQQHTLLSAMVVAASVGMAGAVLAADVSADKPTTPVTTAAQAIAPSRAETADAAFKKLDVGGKGYVTKDDVKVVAGFDKMFDDNDANHDGRLAMDEFKKAWTAYSGNKG